MSQDPIVEEIHRIRVKYAEQFDNDIHAICEDARKRQAQSDVLIISRPARKPLGKRSIA